jgi:hypothetical protein
LEVVAACQGANNERSALDRKLTSKASPSAAAIEDAARAGERIDEAMIARVRRLPFGIYTMPVFEYFTSHRAELESVVSGIRGHTMSPELGLALLRSLLSAGGGCGPVQYLAAPTR